VNDEYFQELQILWELYEMDEVHPNAYVAKTTFVYYSSNK